RLDSVLACQCKILKAANAEIYGKIAGKLGRKIARGDIETMLFEECLPSERREPRAGCLDVIDLGHFPAPDSTAKSTNGQGGWIKKWSLYAAPYRPRSGTLMPRMVFYLLPSASR